MKTSQLSVLKRIDALLARASSRASQSIVAAGNRSGTPPAGVAPGDLTTGTTSPIIVAAMDLTPKASGLFQTQFGILHAMSAADTVTWDVQAVPLVTAITGGAAFGTFHYESLGSPLVVTGGTPVEELFTSKEVATGDITIVPFTIVGLVPLVVGERCAIVLRATTAGGAHLTTINIQASSYELP